MGQIKKSRKHRTYSRQRRVTKVVHATLKGTVVIYMANNDRKSRLVNLKSHDMYSANLQQARVLLTATFPWTVYCAVFCRDATGSEYMKSLEVSVSVPCLHDTLFDSMPDEHLKLLRGCNENHVINVGWLASPDGVHLDEAQAGAIFNKHDAWDALASWEIAA